MSTGWRVQPSGEIQERVPSSRAVSTRTSKLRENSVAISIFGFKTLFQALLACSGDVNAMVEVTRGLIGAGLLAGVAANPDLLTMTVENMASFFSKLKIRGAEREFPGFPRQPRPTKHPTFSSGGSQHHQADYNDPFWTFANEMFVAYTNSEPYWSRGMPMSVEGNNSAQSYYGREGVPPSMVMSMEEYNPQPNRGETGVQPGMVEAMFGQPGHGSNGYYLPPEEGWAASTRGSYAGGADARSFSYGGDYNHGSTPYTTPCNAGDYHHRSTPYTSRCNHYTANNGPMVCGFCRDSACRCHYTQQHTGNMHFQPSSLLLPKHTIENPKAYSSSMAATAAAPGDLDQRAGNGLEPSKQTTKEVQCGCCQRAVGMGYKACGCDACSECVKPSPALDCHPAPFTYPGQHGLTSWVTCYFCGGMIASGVPVLSYSLRQVYACPSCVWIHHNTTS